MKTFLIVISIVLFYSCTDERTSIRKVYLPEVQVVETMRVDTLYSIGDTIAVTYKGQYTKAIVKSK